MNGGQVHTIGSSDISPQYRSFRVSDRVAPSPALRLQDAHLRPGARNPRAASRAVFAANADAAPTIARKYSALSALRPIARGKRATRRGIRKQGHNPDAGAQLGATSARQRRNRARTIAKSRTITT